MMKNICLVILLAMFVFGCRPVVEKHPYISDTVITDVHGYKYRFVSPAMKNPDGSVTVELWERIDPWVTNYWYTPSLVSQINTNYPPIFNSFRR